MARSNNQKLRIGIVGAGDIVRRRHLPALKKLPDVEVVAVSNSTYESSQEFCDENLPNALPMANWADLLALEDLDIIWIGTPPYMHSAVTVSALEAGKHVFCQARMAMDLAEAQEMLAVESEGRLRVFRDISRDAARLFFPLLDHGRITHDLHLPLIILKAHPATEPLLVKTAELRLVAVMIRRPQQRSA